MSRLGPFICLVASLVFAQVSFATNTVNGSRKEGGEQTPRLALSPWLLNLGPVQRGTIVERWIRIENTGTVLLIVNAASGYSRGIHLACPRFPLVLRPASVSSCKLRFEPNGEGEFQGRVTFGYVYKSHDLGWHRSARTMSVRATTNSEGGLSASPSSLDFGVLQVSQRRILTQTLVNSGHAALTITDLQIDNPAFCLSGINPPNVLGPGQSVSFAVTYSPTSSGPSTGNLRIDSNASPRIYVTLAGNGSTPGHLILRPTLIDFGNVVVGGSRTAIAKLYAAGGPVTLSSATASNSEYALPGLSLPITIPPGRTALLKMMFRPQSPGKTAGLLTLSTTGSSQSGQIGLSGEGMPARQHTVTLDWEASASESTVGYNVYRSTRSGGPYLRINSAVDPATTDSDANVSAGQTYYYVVTAVDSDSHESGYSNEANISVPYP